MGGEGISRRGLRGLEGGGKDNYMDSRTTGRPKAVRLCFLRLCWLMLLIVLISLDWLFFA